MIVKLLRPIAATSAATALFALMPASSVMAQRQQPSPEQRLDRLERQVQQVQRQVFPKGRPADTAGFSDDPAASQSSVITLDQRLDALERQTSEILGQAEENNNRLRTVERDNARIRGEQEQRIAALEQRLSEAVTTLPVASLPSDSPPTVARPRPVTSSPSTIGGPGSPGAALGDAGEDAYSEGFRLFEQGQYDAAITSLRAFTSAYPKHRRVSFANNLVGRALLEKGQSRAAAEALLANYRSLPNGERAADSLYYLGQAQMKLGQPGQACRAYSEAEAIYGARMRAELKKMVAEAKLQASCS
jgi:TolA-binding protein